MEGQGLRLSREEGPWHCVADFDLRSGRQGPGRDVRCSRIFLRDGQKSSRAHMLFANFPISGFSFISPGVSVIVVRSLKRWVILRFDTRFFFFLSEGGGTNWSKRITLGRGCWQSAPSEPWGLAGLRPGHWARTLRVTRKSALLNSIRSLENFCTVISSGLLFGLREREKSTQRPLSIPACC